jgi:hypothetical protein
MDWLGEMSLGDGMPRTHKRAFLRPNGIYFLSHLADDALMTGVAVPTPPIIESANKTVKIGSKCKIIHSKHCRIDKFNNTCKQKNASLLSVVARVYIIGKETSVLVQMLVSFLLCVLL